LERLARSRHQVLAVVTGEDRPRGRGHRVLPTPVAEAAAALGLPVMKTPSLKGQEIIDRLAAYSPDVIVLVAFGLMIPAPLLAMPREGCVNLHPSLLPKYRGAAPIHAPLLHGDTLTGVTTMWMSETL